MTNQNTTNDSGNRVSKTLLVAGATLALAAVALGGFFAAREVTSDADADGPEVHPDWFQNDQRSVDDFVRNMDETATGESPDVIVEGPSESAPEGGERSNKIANWSTSASSFACGQGDGMVHFGLPWESAGDYHQFWFRVDGGGWSYTNWYYTEGYEYRIEWNGYNWNYVPSGMTFPIIRGNHVVEAFEYRSSVGWIDMGSCEVWDFSSGGGVSGTYEVCDVNGPNFAYWDYINRSAVCYG